MSGWREWHEEVAAGRSGVLSSVVRGGTEVASRFYGVAVHFRNSAFDKDQGRICTASVPVISVGNLTTGGTGKTPMVIDLAKRLLELGRTPAVISRGYKSDSEGRSDEVVMMQQSLPELQCVVNADRVAGAELAVQNGADVILLDDGFQHRRLARDLDLVLIDATKPFGYGHLLPRGFLREPIENVRRSDAVVLTRSDEVSDHRRAELLRLLAKLAGDATILNCVHKVDSLIRLDGTPVSKEDVETPALLVSGIGTPDSFERSMQGIPIEFQEHLRFPDHHAYCDADVAVICQEASKSGAKSIIITAKDAPKLARLGASWPVPVFVCTVSIDFPDDSGDQMNKLLVSAIERKACRR